MNLTKNFTLEEMVKSSTATRLKIDNTIPSELKPMIYKMAEQMQIIRDAYGKPIVISSGYRCEKLNKAVGGAKNSDHRYASAVDFHSLSDSKADNKALWDLIISLKTQGKLDMRQIINEYDSNWIHCSINNPFNKAKKNEVLYIK